MTRAVAAEEGSPANIRRNLAVFDFGKTNAKMLVFNADGAILRERRTHATWPVDDGLRVLDDVALLRWMQEMLVEAVIAFDICGVMITTHGCTFAMLGETELAVPILDYEEPVPADIEAAFDAIRPPFSETATPAMDRGFAFGKHIVWREMRDPGLAARTRDIVAYPQFWVWRLCGARVSEISSLGCHTHLWSPARNDFSSLVDRRGWRGKMPPFQPAGAIVGQMAIPIDGQAPATINVHNGVHDSNAALYHYRQIVRGRMTLVSTGTWVIVMNPVCPLTALQPERDMLANVSVGRDPVPTARFMGGREFDIIRADHPVTIEPADIAAVIGAQIYAVPSFASGGPFPHQEGAFVDAAGQPCAVPDALRTALAAVYVAAMIDFSLDLLQSTDAVVLDGGLAKVSVIPALLAALRPQQDILLGANTEGTACGAAALAYATYGVMPFQQEKPARVPPFDPAGWRDYVQRWRSLSQVHQPNDNHAAAHPAPVGDSHDASKIKTAPVIPA
ncbi:putative carbohydrate kinase [Neoasaia chiangmaiensis NBRC 101099]|uniref:carbohydrate kinase n=1 Tax=Neoasaia chiangmaiensis TaxID=320497 RepID=UPI00098B819A|nr:carbohydrate kinase [Neoasaia chiangmaiensis]GBR36471.1 putative carbohydrate kinase [Neoasaia chiangmaiensis NBRC 101099]GEN15329.1 carbohydrate kinase [Neoasaia chiangmaiensis]